MPSIISICSAIEKQRVCWFLSLGRPDRLRGLCHAPASACVFLWQGPGRKGQQARPGPRALQSTLWANRNLPALPFVTQVNLTPSSVTGGKKKRVLLSSPNSRSSTSLMSRRSFAYCATVGVFYCTWNERLCITQASNEGSLVVGRSKWPCWFWPRPS